MPVCADSRAHRSLTPNIGFAGVGAKAPDSLRLGRGRGHRGCRRRGHRCGRQRRGRRCGRRRRGRGITRRTVDPDHRTDQI